MNKTWKVYTNPKGIDVQTSVHVFLLLIFISNKPLDSSAKNLLRINRTNLSQYGYKRSICIPQNFVLLSPSCLFAPYGSCLFTCNLPDKTLKCLLHSCCRESYHLWFSFRVMIATKGVNLHINIRGACGCSRIQQQSIIYFKALRSTGLKQRQLSIPKNYKLLHPTTRFWLVGLLQGSKSTF